MEFWEVETGHYAQRKEGYRFEGEFTGMFE